MVAHGGFNFGDFIAQFLVCLIHKVADVQHNVHLVGTILDGEGGFCHLGLDVGLRSGESGATHGNIHIAHLKGTAHHFGKIAIHANGCHILVLRIARPVVVHLLGEGCHRAFAIGGAERGEVHAIEQEFIHLLVIVFCHVLAHDFFHFGSHHGIVGFHLAVGKCLHILVGGLIVLFHCVFCYFINFSFFKCRVASRCVFFSKLR